MDCSYAPLELLPQKPLNNTTYLVNQYLEIGGMVLSKQQVKMLSVFRQDVFASLTFRQLKERNGLTSNNAVQLAVKEFRGLGLVRTATVGDVTTYALDLENGLALAYLNLLEHMEDFARGIVDTRRLVYVGSTVAFFLFLATRALDANKGK